MGRSARLRHAVVPAGFVLAALICAPAEAAGLTDFLDSIFGGATPRAAEPQPLDMTVRPRARAPRVRRARDQRRPQMLANTAIDPVAHPTWYLDDRTLRRGDIVVLDGKVLVFEGGRPPHDAERFTSLGTTRLLSKAERERIRAMTGMAPEPETPPVAAPKAERTVTIERE